MKRWGVPGTLRPAVWVTPYRCMSCGELAIHLETIYGEDEPMGAPFEFFRCDECGGLRERCGEPYGGPNGTGRS